MMARHFVASVLAAAVVFTGASPAAAGRCQSKLTGGVRCQCPDFAALLADPTSRIRCPRGWTPVVYDLGRPFAPDGSTSHLTLRAARRSLCAGIEQDEPFGGKILGCWSPLRRGCRTFKVAFGGVCLRFGPVVLGPPCTGACAGAEIGNVVAVGNAGSASFRVCPPKDPATSCRATSHRGMELFRFQTGGLCTTYGCNGDVPGDSACIGGWGATYWGFGKHPKGSPRGWYDWRSGGFKVVNVQRRPACGKLRECLGRRTAPWSFLTVGNPAPGYLPPCLSAEPNPCNPDRCFP